MAEPSSTAERSAAGRWRSRCVEFWFHIDLRSAALFRILLGLVLIIHWVGRWRWLEVLYSGQGVLPASALAEIRDVAYAQAGALPPLGWWTPLEWLDGHLWATRAFFMLAMVCAGIFLIGYRTRLFGFLSLLAWAMLVHRNPYTLIGADFVIGSLLLWAQFLPLGARFSIDALRAAVGGGVALPLQQPGGDEPSVPAPRRSGFSVAALGVVLQIGMIYFFTALWKTLPMLWGESAAWRDGTAIHYVLHMEQSLRTPAIWVRELPLWCIRVLSYGTLVAEFAALPMFLLPWAQPLLRRVAIVALGLLHIGIAVTLDAGLFSHVMIASYAVLLTSEDWAALKRWLARFSRPATVYYDDGCGVCTRTCETMAACDRFGRLAFIGSSQREAYRHAIPEGLTDKTVVVFDDRTGKMYTRSVAMAVALRGLPLPYHLLAWFGLPGVRLVSDVFYDLFARNRELVSRLLKLRACRLHETDKPSSGGKSRDRNTGKDVGPAPLLPTGRRMTFWNIGAALLLAVVVVGNLLENVVGLEKNSRQHRHLRETVADSQAAATPRLPEGLLRTCYLLAYNNEHWNLVLNFAGAIQRWNMFSPDPPKVDHWWVADAELENGLRVDPLAKPQSHDAQRALHPQPDFVAQPSFRERRYPRIWATYLQYGPGELRQERVDMAEITRRELCRYLVETYNAAAAAGQRIAVMDLWQIRAAMPPAELDAQQVAALWTVHEREPSRVERSIVPERQSFNPYRWGLLIASYETGRKEPFESGLSFGDQRRMLRTDWFPSRSWQRHGPFHLQWEAADGFWKERLHNGALQQGIYQRGLRHGEWNISLDDRLLSAGPYERGKRQGVWKSYYADGSLREEVTYRQDRRDGPVVRWHPGRIKMEQGQYQNDQPHGRWTYWDATGFRYQQGAFAQGLREGEWTFWHRNGRTFRREQYRRGVQEGPFVEFHPDGVTVAQQGEMRDGQPHGPWKQFSADGGLAAEGAYVQGLRDGVWKPYFATSPGQPPQVHKEETFVAGKRHGPYVEYYEDGTPNERGQYEDNKRTGKWTAWYPNGKLESEGLWQNDLQYGTWTFWYDNGQKHSDGDYRDGLQQGEWKHYYEDGGLLMVGPFVDGAAHGRWTYYHRNGKVQQSGEFAQGKQTGLWETWNADGTKSAQRHYADGKEVSDTTPSEADRVSAPNR